eukprot:364968-Chlamydomonas_euryale.AAC.21
MGHSGRVGQSGKVWTSTTRGRIANVAPPALSRWPTLRCPGWQLLLRNCATCVHQEAIFAANAQRVILCGLHQRGSNAQWNHPLSCTESWWLLPSIQITLLRAVLQLTATSIRNMRCSPRAVPPALRAVRPTRCQPPKVGVDRVKPTHRGHRTTAVAKIGQGTPM